MKIKKIKIKTKDGFYSDVMSVAKELDAGRTPKPVQGEYFESLEAVRNVLTEKRLELWRLIRDQHPGSILELSNLVKRDFKSVHGDLSMLAAVGLVELRKSKGSRGDMLKPVSLADTLRLEVA